MVHWRSDSAIISGLGDLGYRVHPTVFLDGSTFKLISGEEWGAFFGFYWNGSSWISSAAVTNGLVKPTFRNRSTPTVFLDGSTLKLISGNERGDFYGWYWNGSSWISSAAVINGLSDIGYDSTLTVFLDKNILKLITGEGNGAFTGYYWSGSAWILDASIVSGLDAVGNRSSPTVFLENGVFKLISGEYDGVFTGYYWNGSSWVLNAAIITGLGDVGRVTTPTVFLDGSTLKLISGEISGGFCGWYRVNSIILGKQNLRGMSIPGGISMGRSRR